MRGSVRGLRSENPDEQDWVVKGAGVVPGGATVATGDLETEALRCCTEALEALGVRMIMSSVLALSGGPGEQGQKQSSFFPRVTKATKEGGDRQGIRRPEGEVRFRRK